MKKDERKPSKRNFFSILRRAVGPVFLACPIGFLVESLLSILQGFFLTLETASQQRVFDQAEGLAAGTNSLREVAMAVLLLGAVYIVSQIMGAVVNIVPDMFLDKIDGKLSYGIHRKMAAISPLYYEESKSLDIINKAERGKGRTVMFVYMFWMIGTFYVPYFLFMGMYLFTLKPVLAVSIALVFIPVMLIQLLRTNVFSKLEDKSAPVRRQNNYYRASIIDREYFKETRQLGAFSFFRRMFEETLDLMQKLSFRATVRTSLAELAMRFLTVGGYFGILFFLFHSLMEGDVSLGAFAAVFNSIGKLYQVMEEIVCGHVAKLASNYGAICNYLDFMALPEEKGAGDVLPESDITLERVGFTYPNTSRAALEDVSLMIKKGETIAVVGENGSGKSTLAKLICGIYPPTEGNISYGGREADRYTVYGAVSGVFQDYQKYQMKLRDNICISQMGRQAEDETLKALAVSAGVKLDEDLFPEMLDTMLSREFGGIDLSGGQWQRIAITRGIYRDCWLIVLDEPTSSIDPCEEARIYEKFAQITKGRTAVLITHRIGSVKIADKIAVMKGGRLVEFGRHRELLARDGEYARLLKAQEQWYE